MGFGTAWGSGFYGGGGSSPDVPGRFHFAIEGRPYMLDLRREAGLINGDIAPQRPQVDDAASPSEASLSTEGLWRRTIESWHHGGGQRWYDWDQGDPFRFDTSAGVDPWTERELTLLPGTTQVLADAEPTPLLAVAAGRLYVTIDQEVRYTTDLANWVAITGGPASAVTGIATDGQTVWVAYGVNGIYQIAPGAAAMTAYTTGTVTAVGYAKGRLLAFTNAAASASAYDITTAGPLPGTPLVTLSNGFFSRTAPVAEGPTAIYLAGQIGDKPHVLRVGIKDDGTGLNVPASAAALPDGQVVRSIGAYLNSVVTVGTDDRVWTLEPADAAGNLVTRGSIPAHGPVFTFEPQDRFVWFGDRDGGLSRLDLSTNASDDAAAFAPGYAADLHSGVTGTVFSVATFLGVRVFSVGGQGVYAESDAKVTSGYVETGRIGFGIGDPKNALYADIRHAALTEGDAITVEVAVDDDTYSYAGASAEPGATFTTVPLGQRLAETVRLRITLAGNPTLRGVTIRAAVAPPVGELWQLPVMLFDKVEDIGGREHRHDVTLEREFFRGLRRSQQPVRVQVGCYSFTGLLDRLAEWRSEGMVYDESGVWTGEWNGVQTLVIKKVG